MCQPLPLNSAAWCDGFYENPELSTCWHLGGLCKKSESSRRQPALFWVSMTSCCLMLWPNTSSGCFWRRETNPQWKKYGSLLFGCCFCCFLIISGGPQQLSVTCVSQTFVPISTYHQTSVIYCYGFAHEMKLHWAVVSVLHSWLDLSLALLLPQKKLVWVLSGPCILFLLMKGFLSLVLTRGCIVLPLDLFLSHHSRVGRVSGRLWGFICGWVSQHGWALAVQTNTHDLGDMLVESWDFGKSHYKINTRDGNLFLQDLKNNLCYWHAFIWSVLKSVYINYSIKLEYKFYTVFYFIFHMILLYC